MLVIGFDDEGGGRSIALTANGSNGNDCFNSCWEWEGKLIASVPANSLRKGIAVAGNNDQDCKANRPKAGVLGISI